MSDGLNLPLLLTRFILFVLALVQFGSACFAIYAPTELERTASGAWRAAPPALATLAALAWLSLLGREMTGVSGLPSIGILGRLCLDTGFGRALLMTTVSSAALAVLVLLRCDWLWLRVTLSGVGVISLAFVGHAAVGVGVAGALRIVVMAAHLLAAGVWLGALPSLAGTLRRPEANASLILRRFGNAGLVAVVTVLATGVGSTLYVRAQAGGDLGSTYLNTLLVKLALVAALLVVAAMNRFCFTPMVATESPRAIAALRRTVVLEQMFGLGVVAAVAILGQLDPMM